MEGHDSACQQLSLLSVCSVCSRRYGFSYIIILRQRARITQSLKVIVLHGADTVMGGDAERDINYPSVLPLFSLISF